MLDGRSGEEAKKLSAELGRLTSASHARRLGVGADAAPEAIRAAFLSLVKRYHPQRFSHLGRECERIANEIFLCIKDAHDALLTAAEAGRSAARRKRKTSAAPATPPTTGRHVRFRGGTAPEVPDPPIGKGTAILMRPLVAPEIPARRSEPPPVAPRQERDDPTPPPIEAPPPPVDHVGLVAKLESAEETNMAAYRAANKLLQSGRAGEARQAFKDLAVANPAEKRYRTYMHFAWAREHELAGRTEDAMNEYQRALNVTPTFAPALEGLEALQNDQRQSGPFARLFRGRTK